MYIELNSKRSKSGVERVLRKPLSSGQKWFLRPYLPLIRGMFVFRSGLRFSFRTLEVPEPRVRKMPLSL